MKTLFGLLMILFVASTVWARGQERARPTIESCIQASLDRYTYVRGIKDEQVKIENDFLYCLNSVSGVAYPTLFDVPDDILMKRYEFILAERAKRK